MHVWCHSYSAGVQVGICEYALFGFRVQGLGFYVDLPVECGSSSPGNPTHGAEHDAKILLSMVHHLGTGKLYVNKTWIDVYSAF